MLDFLDMQLYLNSSKEGKIVMEALGHNFRNLKLRSASCSRSKNLHMLIVCWYSSLVMQPVVAISLNIYL